MFVTRSSRRQGATARVTRYVFQRSFVLKKSGVPFPPVQKERSFVTLGCRIDVNQ